MQCRRSLVCGLAVLAGAVLVGVLVFILRHGPCEPEMFHCINSTACIPQKFVCNNHKDCPQGDDESHYTCANFHGKNYFNDLIKISASGTKPDYHSCGLSRVPEGCTCRYSTWLSCKNQGLTEVPQDVDTSVTRMMRTADLLTLVTTGDLQQVVRRIFVNNSLQNLTEESFSRYRLGLIHLSGNGITELRAGIFQDQTHMEKLFLSNNRLRSVHPELLRGLQSLQWLVISNNRLTSLPLRGFRDLMSLTLLDLSHNNLTLDTEEFPSLPRLSVLGLHHNSLTRIERNLLKGLPGLSMLKLQWNSISWIHEDAFRNQIALRELDLSYNQLSALPTSVLSSLHVLSNLNIAWNPFQFVSREIFSGIGNLSSLDLQGIDLEHLDVDLFKKFERLKFVYVKSFYYCTYAPRVRSCRPNTDGVSSSLHLLDSQTLRATVWLVAALTCLGNALVLWGRFSSRDENRELSFVIRNLADLLMGIYLFVIGAQDAQFRNIYYSQAHRWMSSWACTAIGMLAMASSEVSVLILVFLSLERFLLIAVPFGGHQKLTMKVTCRSLSIIWFVGLCLAVIPVIHWRHSTRFYGTSGMCFPLHIDDPFLLGWQYSAFVVLGINTTSLALITVLYTGMFVSIWRTRHATPVSSVRDLEFIIRFFFIVLTDAGCWAPIIVLKLLAMCRIQIPVDLYAWVVVFILPVNSAVNPLLYTFTTPRYRARLGCLMLSRWALGNLGRSHSTQSSLVARHQSTVDTEYSSHRNMICTLISKKKMATLDLYPSIALPNAARLPQGPN